MSGNYVDGTIVDIQNGYQAINATSQNVPFAQH